MLCGINDRNQKLDQDQNWPHLKDTRINEQMRLIIYVSQDYPVMSLCMYLL